MVGGFQNDTERLPDRIAYLYNEMPAKGHSCLACADATRGDPEGNFILLRGENLYIKLYPRPYSNGHLVIVPFRHVCHIDDLCDKENLEIMQVAQISMGILRPVFHPDGFHFGVNIDLHKDAALFPHLIFHIIPRRYGDANLYTAIGSPRELAEILQQAYRRLKDEFETRVKK